MAVEENRIHFRKLVQTLQWTFLMLLSVQHNLSKTQTVLFTLVSGVTCLYVGLLGLRLRAGVVWRGRGRGSSCPALTLLATVCTAHVRHAGTRETRGDTCLLTWCRGSGAPLRCRRCHVPSHIPAPAAAGLSTKYHHLMMALELESNLSKVLRSHNHRECPSWGLLSNCKNFAKIRF